MTNSSILTRLTTVCSFSQVFQDTERAKDRITDIPRLKIGHIRADYDWRWWNTVWPCHIELATDETRPKDYNLYLNAFVKGRPE